MIKRLLCSLVLIVLLSPVMTHSTESPKVLVLHSYHIEYGWTASIDRGLHNSLLRYEDMSNFYVEFMDTKRFFSDSYLDLQYRFLEEKYSGFEFDLIVISDNNAFNFFLQYRAELFQNAPVVFCGLNGISPEDYENENLTGLIEDVDIQSNIELIDRLHQGNENLIVVSDTTVTGRVFTAQAREILQDYDERFQVEYITSPSLNRLAERIQSYTEPPVVLLLSLNNPPGEGLITTDESIRRLMPLIHAPVYSNWDFAMGSGVIGGMLTSGYLVGIETGRLASRILNGEDPDNIPIQPGSPKRYLFDYNALEEHNISLSQLPEGSEVRNIPVSVYEEYTLLIWVIIIFLILQSFVITVLFIINAKRRENGLRLQAVLDLMPSAVAIHEQSGKLRSVNRTFFSLFGYSAEEVEDLSLQKISGGDYSELQFERLFQRVYAEGDKSFEWTCRRKDGKEFPTEVRLRKLQLGGREYVLSVINDLTQRRIAELEHERLIKLKSLGSLAGGIAHDFNNVLTRIIGNLSLMHVQELPLLQKDECIDQAMKASLEAKALTQQLLTFSKGGEPVKEAASVAQLLEETCNFLIQGRTKNLEVNIQEGLWNSEVDSGQIAQVFHNILLNAKEASPKDESIIVIAENIELMPDDLNSFPEYMEPGDYIKVSITDKGCGISQEQLSTIFDPYFTTKADGTGMGLPISYSIMKRHKGYLQVTSKKNQGTRVTAYIPAKRTTELASSASGEDGIIKNGRALVMDDEPGVLMVMTRMLRHLGLEVDTAYDGEEAIALYRTAADEEKPFHFIILDLIVPGGMGGKEAMQRLQKIDPDVKAVVSSGYSNDPILAEYKRFGFADILSKPYQLEQVKALVLRLLPEDK
ncbi:MAG: ATP-binding protein [Spirochaetia bacterium]